MHPARAYIDFMYVGPLLSLVASVVLALLPGTAMPATAGGNVGKPSAQPDRIVLNAGPNVSTTQIITWRTSTKVTKGYVQISAGAGKVRSIKQRKLTRSAPSNTAYRALHHTATVTKLKAGAVYRYRVGSAKHYSTWKSFRTATGGNRWSMVSFGDTQLASAKWLGSIADRAFATAPKATALVQLGDIVQDPRHDNDWGNVFDALGGRLSRMNLFYTPGNHDQCLLARCARPSNTAYRAHFEFANNGVKGQTQDWYYSDINNARIISLNSFGSLKTQRAFLANALKNSRQAWNIVMFHAPVFSGAKGRENAAMRDAWLPILQRYDVDLVISGHDHVYSRGHLDGAPDGTQYAVQVTSPKFYELTGDDANDWTRHGAVRVTRAEQTATYGVLDFSANTLNYRAVVAAKGKGSSTPLAVGKTLDAFTIAKDGNGTKRVTSYR